MRKLEQLNGHNLFEPMNLSDAVANFDHGADFIDGDPGFKVFDLLPNDFVDFVCFDWLHN